MCSLRFLAGMPTGTACILLESFITAAPHTLSLCAMPILISLLLPNTCASLPNSYYLFYFYRLLCL